MRISRPNPTCLTTSTPPPQAALTPLPSPPAVKLNGNRHITGTLRGFDQFMNLVIDEAVEQALPRPHLARALPASTSCKHAHARARSGTFRALRPVRVVRRMARARRHSPRWRWRRVGRGFAGGVADGALLTEASGRGGALPGA